MTDDSAPSPDPAPPPAADRSPPSPEPPRQPDAPEARRPPRRRWPEPEAPGEDPERWVELVRTMLPAPVQLDEDGTLVGGDPGEVVVRVYRDWIVVSRFAIRWNSQRPEMAPVEAASSRLDEAQPAQVAGAIAEARAERVRTYRWCHLCREVRPPEWMDRESVCQGCAERYLGVIY